MSNYTNNAATTALQVIQPQLPQGSIEAYLQRVNEIPLLSPEEEFKLATQFKESQDLKAAQQLVLSHLRYVVKVARGYLGYGLPLGDLIQEGSIGLMKAVKRFDPTMGVRLVSFAVHWIKAEIHEYVLRNWRIVKVATTKAQRKLFFNLRSAKKRLGWSSAEEVNAIAEDLGVSAEEVLRMEERLNARDSAFDAPVDEAEGEVAHIPARYLEDTNSNPMLQIEDQNWSNHSEDRLKQALSSLDSRSQDILARRYLIEDSKSTLQDLADHYQVSPERIRQLEKNALLKLKAAILLEAA